MSQHRNLITVLQALLSSDLVACHQKHNCTYSERNTQYLDSIILNNYELGVHLDKH
jgi:hypothetical protein